MRTLFLIFCTVTSPLLGTITIQISPSVSSPQLVGTPITLTAVASDTQAGTLDYQFSVALAGQSPQVVMDFSLQNAFTWAPSSREGAYIIQVIARNKTGGDSVSAQLPFEIQSRVTGAKSVISPTAHPLVALYSAPPCPAGSSIYVVFGTAGSTNRTDQRSCDGQTSVNFYIAGMLATTTYEMYAVTVTGPDADLGPAASFTTGAIPTDLQFPPTSLLIPPGAQVETDQSVLFIANSSIDFGGFGLFYFPTATDLNGNVIWYYSVLGTRLQAPDYFTRTVDGGTVLLIASDPDSDRADIRGQIWREIDLAGNTIRQTNATRITEQLNALGLFGVTDFDHDSIRLPNGHTLILCSQELMYPAQTQASPVPLDVIGDAIVDLDENLQVAWSWSAFDHMDVNRAAILGETCAPFAGGCVPVYLAPIAADWLHGNSLNFIPSSGDVLLSLRDSGLGDQDRLRQRDRFRRCALGTRTRGFVHHRQLGSPPLVFTPARRGVRAGWDDHPVALR